MEADWFDEDRSRPPLMFPLSWILATLVVLFLATVARL